MAIKDRLIQFVFRGKNELSPEAKKLAEDLDKVRVKGKELTDELDKAKGAQGLLINFRSTGEEAERIRRTLERTEQKAAELREELNKNPGSKGLADSLRAAERDAARAGRELDKLTVETKKAEAAAQAAGIDTRNLAEEEKRLAAEVDKAKAAVTDNTKQLRDLERQQRAAARGAAEHKSRVDAARQSMTNAGKAVLGFAAAYVSLNAALGLVRRGFDLVRGGIARVIGEGSGAENSIAQLNAALVATGSAAGWSAEQLLKMADDLRDVSNFSTEQIIDAQTRLLSYTDVVGEQFPAAMQIVIDQAQRLGISVEQSAETVGQALQSPSKAMAALGRQGFTLEKSQQDLLKRLEATGRMAEAQAIIMDMLTESYGGSAAAARLGTATGLWKGLQDQIGDFFGMISSAGAFDYVKDKLQEWTDKIIELKDSGHLKQLAESLSNAFIQGAEKVEEFIKSLAKVDFDTLIKDSSRWLNNFGAQIDDARMRVQLFFAPFRTLFNGVTAGFAMISAAGFKFAERQLSFFQRMADLIPDMFGGDKISARLREARDGLDHMSRAMLEQAEQDGRDIRNAWDTTANHIVGSQKTIAETAKSTSEETKNQWTVAAEAAAAAAQMMAKAIDEQKQKQIEARAEYDAGNITLEEYSRRHNEAAQAIVELGKAAADAAKPKSELANQIEALRKQQEAARAEYDAGSISLEEYSKRHNEADDAIKQLIASSEKATSVGSEQAKAVAQMKEEQAKLFEEYRKGNLTLEEYQQKHNALAAEIAKLGTSASSAASGIDEVIKTLGDLADVQGAIKNAKTDVDINKLAAAIRKMYADGKLTADEYKQAMEALEKQKAELKKATDEQSKSEKGLAGSIDLVTKALEEKAAKERAAQQAADDAAAKRAQDVAAWGGYFDSVMTAAREPLAALSEQALAAFDSIRGITTADMSIDTSGIEATRASMERLRESMAATQMELADNLRHPLAKWASEQIQLSQQIRQDYLQQKLALQELMDRYERGTITLQGFRNEASRLKNGLTLLDQSDLSQLESAIASVKQQMEAVGDSARNTLDSIRDELDRLQGDTEAIEQRRMASRRRDLQAQIAEARAAGNGQAVSDLTQALAMLKTIEAEQQHAREQELRQNRREAQEATAPGAGTAAPSAPVAPATVIRLESARGNAVDLSVPQGQEDALLSILEQAGMRTI